MARKTKAQKEAEAAVLAAEQAAQLEESSSGDQEFQETLDTPDDVTDEAIDQPTTEPVIEQPTGDSVVAVSTVEGEVSTLGSADTIVAQGDSGGVTEEPQGKEETLTKIFSTYETSLHKAYKQIVFMWKAGYDLTAGTVPRLGSSNRTMSFTVERDFDQLALRSERDSLMTPPSGTYYKVTLSNVNAAGILKELKDVIDNGGFLDLSTRPSNDGMYIIHVLSKEDLQPRAGLRNYGAIELK